MEVNSDVAGEQILKEPLEKCYSHSTFDIIEEKSRQYLTQSWRVNKKVRFAVFSIFMMLFSSLEE